MLNFVVGAILGYLAGLGVGGGSLLMLWLTWIVGTTQTQARAINLLFFLASAGAVSIVRFKQGKLQPKILLPAILAGCAGAAIFSPLSAKIDVQLIKKAFGALLLWTGIREVRYREQ